MSLIARSMVRPNGMIEEAANTDVPLIGSPYDLRVALGAKVSEFDTKAALESALSLR